MNLWTFSPDWCFGLLEQKFRRSRVNCLDDVVKVVNESTVVNDAQLVGTHTVRGTGSHLQFVELS